MTQTILILIIAVFLPLFPMSMLFNALMAKMRSLLLRLVLVMLWPQVGLALVWASGVDVPSWVLVWAAATALFYAFRLTVIREMGLWISFLATSTWALLWLFSAGLPAVSVSLIAVALSLPLVLLSVLSYALIQRYGAAYTHLLGGLAQNMPRFSGIFVLTVLATTATPIFPGFFIMLKAIALSSLGLMLMLGLTWLIWSWAAARLIQGTIVGERPRNDQPDISRQTAWLYGLALVVLAIGGSLYTGSLL